MRQRALNYGAPRGDSEGVMFVNQRIRTLLAVGGEATAFQVVAGEALVASGVAVFEDGEGGGGGHGSYGTSFGANPVAALTELL